MDYPRAVARFCAFYPGLYLSLAWPTADHIIPWGLFWMLYRQLESLQALERVNQSRAIILALGTSFSGKLPPELEKDIRLAHGDQA